MERTKIGFISILGLLFWVNAVLADDVAVTVYNDNLGVVHERRTLEFSKGTGKLSFIDVPSLIDATSVGFEMTDKDKAVSILEQNYAYDLVSPDKIYDKYIDMDIDLIDKTGKIFNGTLLSYSGGAVVLKEKSGKIEIVRMEEITNTNFPALPEGLISRPTLFWLYKSDFTGKAECDVSYQTSGLKWTAEYVGILSEDEKWLDWNGWASIENNCGATFKEAKLKLVAGSINRASEIYIRGGRNVDMLMAAKAPMADESFEEKSFFEYHLYTLPRPATIANNEIKQISLFNPSQTGVEKEYTYEPENDPQNVQVRLKFVNSKETGLGMPLPSGRVRIFKGDTDGSTILLGEDRIKHTPKDEKISLKIGNSFDIKAEQKVLNYERISDRVDENSIEITIRNHKKEDVIIILKKKIYGDWTIQQSNYQFSKQNANTAVFNIPVKSDGTTVVTMTIRNSR
jgi:hypothetical protein